MTEEATPPDGMPRPETWGPRGAEVRRVTMRALRGAAQGGGPVQATSRGVGQSPTKARFEAKPRLSVEDWQFHDEG